MRSNMGTNVDLPDGLSPTSDIFRLPIETWSVGGLLILALFSTAHLPSAASGDTNERVSDHAIKRSHRKASTTVFFQRQCAQKLVGHDAGARTRQVGADSGPRVLKTDEGIAFSVLGPLPVKPAPTLIVLSGDAQQTLADDDYLQCGVHLKDRGYFCFSIDLPCHGTDLRPDEAEGLAGWKNRLDAGESLVESFNSRLTRVLDYLIALKYTDETRIAVCGTSRGAFLAFHSAARDSRIRCILGMAPVTTLLALEEFKTGVRSKVVAQQSLEHIAAKLADRGVWIVIGDQDQRVNTDEAVRFARLLSKTALEQNIVPQIDLLVLAEQRGHTTPRGAAAMSAIWLEGKFANVEK